LFIMFEIHYKYTDYQTFKQTFRELFFPFLIIFQPLIRITSLFVPKNFLVITVFLTLLATPASM